MPVCECGTSADGGSLQAENCDTSLQPVSLEANATVQFLISKRYQRLRLISNRGNRGSSPNRLRKRQQRQGPVVLQNNGGEGELSFTFRTETPEGQLMSAETANSNDYTHVYVHHGRVSYETKKSGFPVINLNSTVDVTSGIWHTVRLSRVKSVVQIFLDEEQVGYDLENSLTQDFLDPYLASLTFGGKSSPTAPG
jgi:hypothetical protein